MNIGSIIGGLCLLTFTLPAISLQAQGAGVSAGVAWQVQGLWRVEGERAAIVTGDAVQPGSLLQPSEGNGPHSITVLLPDGRRVLYECFTAKDCARGFRVPALYRKPEPFAIEMLARIRRVLLGGKQNFSTESAMQREGTLPHDEAIAVLDHGNQVEVAGLAAKLPDGRYTGDLRQLDAAHPRHFHLVIEKKAPSIRFAVPSSGLYVLTIADNLNTPRIDLFIAAVKPVQAASVRSSFDEAKALMKGWNDDYFGWPIHDFQRAYLESLVLGETPLGAGGQIGAAGKFPSNAGTLGGNTAAGSAGKNGVTAEPKFSPSPGVFDGDTAVTLRCDTPGAAMHYTVDGSQPIASSPVYGAPIMVKGAELTIKSFASSAGKRDSAVVTGIFRIR